MAAESRFAEVSDEYLSLLLHESIPKSTKNSTKYGMKIFSGRNAQNNFDNGGRDCNVLAANKN